MTGETRRSEPAASSGVPPDPPVRAEGSGAEGIASSGRTDAVSAGLVSGEERFAVPARGSKAAGLEPIRVHDLRHSHVSLLIDMGFTALAIADRMGHEAADITYRYAHLFPSVQADMARALDGARREN